jgi:uncharacterized membrane protein YhdT
MTQEKESLRKRLGAEVRSAVRLTLYFGIWFSALNLLVHETQGRSGLPLEAWGFAWVKAALCAKFLLIGQMLMPMPKADKESLWLSVLPRSLVYLLVVIVLNVLEEGLRGMLHGGSFTESMAGYAGGNPLRFVALTWVYWLILVPYLLLSQLLINVRSTETVA